MRTVQAQEIKRWPIAVVNGCSLPIAPMRRADIALLNNGFDAWAEMYVYQGASREHEEVWRIDPAPQPPIGENKGDYVTGCVVRYVTGQVVVRVVMFSHFTHESTGRPFIMSMADITDAGAVYMEGNPTHFDRVSPLPAATVPPGVPPASYPTLSEIVTGVDLVLRDDINRIVDNMKPKAKAAAIELNMHSQSMQERGVDQWVKDRVWQTFEENVPGFWAWLREQVAKVEDGALELLPASTTIAQIADPAARGAVAWEAANRVMDQEPLQLQGTFDGVTFDSIDATEEQDEAESVAGPEGPEGGP
jgi:hypothetical protein